jgi:two-component system sensor histidine kinase KdpD
VRAWTAVVGRLLPVALAVAAPVGLTALLHASSPERARDYVYVYLAIVAVLGVASGLAAALVAAGASFLLVDYIFVAPVHTFQFAEPRDLVNLCVFFGVAGLVGTVGSRRRAAQLRAQALARHLRAAYAELERLAETERRVEVLEEGERLRREVLAEVSHELRTPLASLLTGSTGILQRSSLPDDLRRDVDSLAAVARRLNRLVSDILDLTRIERGVLELRPVDVDLVEAVEAAARRLAQASPAREVRIDVPPGTPEVLADWDRLGQVLDNLLDNADRVAPPGTPIEVGAHVEADRDVVVSVADRGPGIPPGLRGRVFERFVSMPTPGDGRSGGIGLGLPIVRGLVQAQHGRVWIEGAPGGAGTRVAFTVPAAANHGEDHDE